MGSPGNEVTTPISTTESEDATPGGPSAVEGGGGSDGDHTPEDLAETPGDCQSEANEPTSEGAREERGYASGDGGGGAAVESAVGGKRRHGGMGSEERRRQQCQADRALARSSLRDYDTFLFAADATEPARAVAAPGADEGAGVADEGAARGHMHPLRAATAVSPQGHAAENTGGAGDDMPPARDAAGATKRPHAEASQVGSTTGDGNEGGDLSIRHLRCRVGTIHVTF